uniref:Bile acid-CoA:amino acid N-acyltransferase-like n=1 Tax=Poecilia latipinna TaxID=48699 RepID=A0A3B3TUJ1_9TELE
ITIWHSHCFYPAGKVRWKSNTRPAPVLTAAPVRALVDEQVSIRGHFLPLHCPVTLHARMHSDEGDLWESFAHYNADERGTFSLGGSYLGCEPMGLFWSMQPAPGGREGLRLRKKSVESPYTVHVSLLEGHVSTSEGQWSELAAVTVERWYIAPGVKRIEINQNGLVGTLFIPPGPGPFPAMLDLWGMGGGLQEYRSSLLASKGYVSFSLAYFGWSLLVFLPQAAFLLLQDHPQVVSDRVGIIGLSFGCYLTLRIPTKTGVKVRHEAYFINLSNVFGTFNSWFLDHQIEERLRSAGKSHLLTRLSYPGAGHLIEPPYSPSARTSISDVSAAVITMWGGHPALHAAAQEDAWKKILDYLEKNLRS